METKFQENQILQLLFRASALKYLNDLLKEKSALPNELIQKRINNSAIILKNELNDLTKTIKKFIETEFGFFSRFEITTINNCEHIIAYSFSFPNNSYIIVPQKHF